MACSLNKNSLSHHVGKLFFILFYDVRNIIRAYKSLFFYSTVKKGIVIVYEIIFSNLESIYYFECKIINLFININVCIILRVYINFSVLNFHFFFIIIIIGNVLIINYCYHFKLKVSLLCWL